VQAEELGAAGGDDKARRDQQPQQPPAKRLATELPSPPASGAGPEAIPGIGVFGQLQPGAGTTGLPGFGLPPASGFPPMASATALSPPGSCMCVMCGVCRVRRVRRVRWVSD